MADVRLRSYSFDESKSLFGVLSKEFDDEFGAILKFNLDTVENYEKIKRHWIYRKILFGQTNQSTSDDFLEKL